MLPGSIVMPRELETYMAIDSLDFIQAFGLFMQ